MLVVSTNGQAPQGERRLLDPRRAGAVLFDLDGTLIDSIPLIRESFRHACRTVLGVTLPDEVLLSRVGMPLERQMRAIAPDRADELVRVYREHNHARHDAMVRAYPGAAELLATLKAAGKKVGVVTSKSSPLARRGLAVAGLDEFVDCLVAADDVVAHKPDPEPVRACLRGLGAHAGEAVFVGDSPFDIEAGNRAGLFTVAVATGPFTEEQLRAARPDLVARSLEDVRAALL